MNITNADILNLIKSCEIFDTSFSEDSVVLHFIHELGISKISYRIFYNDINIESSDVYIAPEVTLGELFECKKHSSNDRLITLKIFRYVDSKDLSTEEKSFLSIFAECTLCGISNKNLLKAYENVRNFDSLTKLTNINYFTNHLSKLIEKESSVLYSVACINIKNCGAINRIFGSDTVDKIIREFAQDNLELFDINKDELLSRLSSDTFIMTVPTSRVDEVIDKMKSATVNVELNGDIVEYNVDIRAGIVNLKHNDRKASEIVHLAEHALVYSRYEQYSDVFKISSHSSNQFEPNSNLSQEIHESMKSNKLFIYYKPSLRLNEDGSYRLSGAEAQLRFRKNGEMVNPVDLIPNSPENSNLLRDINEYLFRNTCRQINEWSEQNINTVPVAIELFAFDYFNTAFAENIIRSIDGYHINRHDIILEFDEKNFHGHFQEMLICAEKCFKAGIRVAIKNYGFRESSLGLLRDIKCQYIKLSPNLVNTDSNKDNIILENIIKMISSLGLEVICTDPESEEIAKKAIKYGCGIFQGDIFDKYLSERFFERRLRNPIYNDAVNE